MDQDRLDLPGLQTVPDGDGPITAAASSTLDALRCAGLLEPRHALTCQVVMSLAGAVDRGLVAHKVSVATATLSKHLLEAIATLPQPQAAGGDVWDEFQRKLAEAQQ